MRVDEITIEVRSLALGRLGQIDLRLVTDMLITKRFNNVGAWTMSLPAEYSMTRELGKKGRGLTVEGPKFTLMSGRVLNWSLDQNSADPQGTMKFVGVDDNVHLADATAWPQPSNSNVETQNLGHDIRSGLAETISKAYVSANIGPTAPAVRRIANLTIATDQQRGNLVTGRARFDKLGLLLSDICAPGVGDLGFEIRQVGTSLVFDVYEPADKSSYIRMDIMNDTLESVTYAVSSPAETRAIIAGQGEMENRRILMVTDAEAAAAEDEWGRKIEVFHDRRDTEEDSELIQTGTDAIVEGGRTLYSLSVRPSNDQTMVYGEDWYLGDIVSVTVDEEVLVSTVTEAIISISAAGVTVGATVGDPSGFDFESKMIAKQQNQEVRLAFLEKNAEAAVGTFDIGRIPNLPATKITSGTFAQARIPVLAMTQMPTQLTNHGRGTTAQRDAYFGATGTVALQVALANKVPTWFNTQKGYTEVYYAPTGATGLTAPGLIAGTAAGWYPEAGSLITATRVHVNSFQNMPSGGTVGSDLGTGFLTNLGGFGAASTNGIIPPFPGYYSVSGAVYFSGGGAMQYVAILIHQSNGAGGWVDLLSSRAYGPAADVQVTVSGTGIRFDLNRTVTLSGSTAAAHNMYGDGLNRRTFLTLSYDGPLLA